MSILDLRDFENESSIEVDIVIVGSGPAGLSIAHEFVGTDLKVCLLESGGLEEEKETQSLYDIESVGVPRVMEQRLVRNRILGGSSHTWYGRCAPFDAIDFQSRDWVPYSGWPISPETLHSYEQKASDILGLGSDAYGEEVFSELGIKPKKDFQKELLINQFWQYSKVSSSIREPMRFGRYLLPRDSKNVDVILHANLTHINTDPTGRKVESVDVQTLEGKCAQIKTDTLVLCCGGIENARLLLASNKTVACGLGNQNDTVGRFLMDHPGTVLGEFKSTKDIYAVQNYIGERWVKNTKGKHVYDHGIALSPEIQKKEELLNCAIFLQPFEDNNDPWQAVKRLRDKIKGTEDAATVSFLKETKTILGNPGKLLSGLYRQIIESRPPSQSSYLYCLVEQRPNPDSRVTLSEHKDALGMPISAVNWQISEQERLTVQRFGELICEEFKRLGIPQPMLPKWLYDKEGYGVNFQDRAHPTGTTRMSGNPHEGVVDSNCKVHGVEGLFIAGSSVFPTSSHVNPTLTIVALAIRLADHLKQAKGLA